MKRTYAIVALGSVLSGVESKIVRWANDKRDADWRPAQATVAVDQLLHGMSPKPTNAPRAPDAAPDRSLDKRASTDNTCAYISGIVASSMYCDTDQYCAYNSIYSFIGCCSDPITTVSASSTITVSAKSCPVWTTCFDSTESALFSTDDGYTLYCGQSTYPVCIQHLYKDPQWTGYTLWGCARSQRTDFVYYTPTLLSDTATTSSTRSSSTTTTSDDTSTATSGSATGFTSTTHTADPSTSTTAAPVSGGSKSTPVGPIVGGVVGGVAALGLIGLALFFFLRKKKSPADAPAAAAAGPTSPGQAPPPGPPQGGYYDPNQPQMAQQQGQYGYGAAGFAPVDPRASIAKPPYAVQQGEYNPAYSPPGSPPPPGSPAPAYNGAPGSTPPPPGAYGGQQPVSPDNTGYGQQQPYQATQYNQYPNAPPQQAQPYGQPPAAAHPTQFAAELPTQRGDGEVRELAG